MKELSIEQKAKAYDEAIEKLREFYRDYDTVSCLIDVKEELANRFPELKEDEDERIRTFLHHTFTAQYLCKDKLGKWHGEPVVNILAWLEGEQKPAVFIPKFRVGDIVKSKSQPMLSPRKIISIGKDCYRCEDRGCIGFAWEDDFEIVEQNHAWSEWDEKIYNLLYEEYKNLAYYSHSREKAEDIPGEVLGWLKSLKNRVLPQPKQEWSEEDEEIINKISIAIAAIYSCSTAAKVEKWLKSLKERYTWNPSGEQMKELHNVFNDTSAGWDDNVIESLYNDLKKLKG